MTHPIVVGVTGASGAVYARRLLEVLGKLSIETHLTISPSGKAVLEHELAIPVSLDRFDAKCLVEDDSHIRYHHHMDMMSPIASGSFLTRGMVICPCSGGTLSGVATGASGNLVKRAADVHLKERRTLIVVPRETPLSLIHLDNMRTLAAAGAVVLPAAPGWYHGVAGLRDLVDFIVARILDQLQIPHDALMQRWGETPAVPVVGEASLRHA